MAQNEQIELGIVARCSSERWERQMHRTPVLPREPQVGVRPLELAVNQGLGLRMVVEVQAEGEH